MLQPKGELFDSVSLIIIVFIITCVPRRKNVTSIFPAYVCISGDMNSLPLS